MGCSGDVAYHQRDGALHRGLSDHGVLFRQIHRAYKNLGSGTTRDSAEPFYSWKPGKCGFEWDFYDSRRSIISNARIFQLMNWGAHKGCPVSAL